MVRTKGRACYLIAAAGVPNLGDDLIAIMWIKYIRRVRPDLFIYVDCVNAARFSVLLQRLDLAQNVCCVDFLWRLSFDYGKFGLFVATETYLPRLEANDSVSFEDANWPFVMIDQQVELVHFLGGGYLSDIWENNLLLLPLAAMLKRRFGCRLVGTGLGLHISSEALRHDFLPYFGSFDGLSVRDRDSLAVLDGLGSPTLSNDDVVLGLPVELPLMQAAPGIVLNLQRHLRSAEEFASSVRAVREFLRDRPPERVELWNFFPGSDRSAERNLRSAVPDLGILDYVDCLEQFLNVPALSPETFCVGTRYHFHLLCAWFGAPVMVLSSGAFYDSKHRLVVEMGSNSGSFPNVPTAPPAIDRSFAVHQKISEAASIYDRGRAGAS